MSEPVTIMLALLLLSCLASCIALLVPSNRNDATQDGTSRWSERFVALLGLRDVVEDPALLTRLKRAGLPGRNRAKLYLLARICLPLFAIALGFGYAIAFPDAQRPVLWVLSLVAALGFIGYVLPSLYLRRRILRRQAAIRREWPDTLDMLLLSVEGGLGLDVALREVANRLGDRAPVLAEELNTTLVELVYLADRKQALSNFAGRIDLPSVSLVITALLQAERYGTPIASALRAATRDQRETRMAEAERKAAALPPRLTIPMIVFFLPVLFVVIFTPGILLYLFER